MSEVKIRSRTSTDNNVVESLQEVTSTQLGNKRSLDVNVTAISGLSSDQFISGQIEAALNKTYTLDLYSIDERTINSLIIKTASGTCTAAIEIDGVAVTGISAVSVSSVEASAAASGFNTVAIGQTITLVITSNSAALDLVFTLKYTRIS